MGSCEFCHKESVVGEGTSCKLCGMPLKDASKEFCSKDCRQEYQRINTIK